MENNISLVDHLVLISLYAHVIVGEHNIKWYIILNLFLFLSTIFLIFHNTVMIYNTRNCSNDITESQKEKKTCVMIIFSTGSQKPWD